MESRNANGEFMFNTDECKCHINKVVRTRYFSVEMICQAELVSASKSF